MDSGDIQFNQFQLDLLKQCYQDLKDHEGFTEDKLCNTMVDYSNNLMKDVFVLLRGATQATEFLFEYHKDKTYTGSGYNPYQLNLLAKIYETVKLNLAKFKQNLATGQTQTEESEGWQYISLDNQASIISSWYIEREIIRIVNGLYLSNMTAILAELPDAKKFVYQGC